MTRYGSLGAPAGRTKVGVLGSFEGHFTILRDLLGRRGPIWHIDHVHNNVFSLVSVNFRTNWTANAV